MERHKRRSIQVQMLKMQKYVIENEGNRAELADYEVYEWQEYMVWQSDTMNNKLYICE